MVFCLEITNIWQPSREILWEDFFDNFKIHKLVRYGFSYGFLVVLNVFHQKFVITNVKLNPVLSRTAFKSILES